MQDSNNDQIIDELDDPIEDTLGGDSRPGKVVLVNDADRDADGVVDYADGFDYLMGLPDDNLADANNFTPLKLNVADLDTSQAQIRFRYYASDPGAMQSTFNAPYVLASGTIRVWTVAGEAARDARRVSEGGHYVAPGVYMLADLGLAASNTVTFYVEAVRESTAVADITIAVDLDPTGSGDFLVSDQVRLTSVRFELLGKNHDESVFTPVQSVVASYLPNEGLAAGDLLPGAYQTYKIQVHDPRQSGISQITVAGQALSLQRLGDHYETTEFIVPSSDSASQSSSILPVQISDSQVNWSYNPFGWFKSSRPKNLEAWDTELAGYIAEAVKEMERDWRPANPADNGAFGKELHRRVDLLLRPEDNWLSDLYVERGTNRLLGVGEHPGLPNEQLTQVDAIRFKDGYYPQLGEVIDHTKIDDVYDIKSAASGKMEPDQAARQRAILNGGDANGPRKLKIALSPRRWSATAVEFVDNPRYLNGFKILGLLGLATTANAMIHSEAYADEFDSLVQEANRIKRINDPANRVSEIHGWLDHHVKPYVSHFAPDDNIVNFGFYIAKMNVLIDEILQQD